MVLGVAGFAVALAHREKTLGGELLAAAALSSAALPVAIAAGLPIGFAAAIVGAWVASFGVGTAAARGIALRLKDAGRSLRIAGASTLVVGIACAAIATTGVAPLRAALAPVPTLLLAIVLVVRPVPVSKIRKVGWAMIAASVVTLGLLVAPIGQV